MKIIIWSLLCFFMFGCGMMPSEQKYNTSIQKFVGAHVSQLESSVGYPSRKLEAFNGDSVYVYDTSSTYVTPVKSETKYTPPVAVNGVVYVPEKAKTKTTGGVSISKNCSTFFTINKDTGIIESARYKGNSCTSY
jgi:hypothetical protein